MGSPGRGARSCRTTCASRSLGARAPPSSPREPTGGPPLSHYILKLYVTGKTSKAEVAIANLRRICEEDLGGQYEMEIIDILERPQLAEDEKILATPTVVKELPVPIRRIIGDLSDTERVLLGLDLRPRYDGGGSKGGAE